MSKRIALLFLAAASPAILVTSVVGTPFGELVFALVAVAYPMALIVLGAVRRGRLGPLARPLVGLALYYEACVVGMYLLRGQVADGPWILGLPLATAIQVYGVFLLPLVFVSLLYAATFESFGPSPGDLEQLRRRFRPDGDA